MTSIDFLTDLAEKLRTQDNAYTASPNYCIQENRLICGIDEDYGGKVGWFAEESNNPEAEGSRKHRALERYYDKHGHEPNGWTRCTYEYRWTYTGISFLTHAAAHAYVKQCNYRHTYEIRVYVDSHYRNREMKEVRRLLAGPVVDCLRLLVEARATLEMWADVAPSVSLCADIDAALASLETSKEPHQ